MCCVSLSFLTSIACHESPEPLRGAPKAAARTDQSEPPGRPRHDQACVRGSEHRKKLFIMLDESVSGRKNMPIITIQ